MVKNKKRISISVDFQEYDILRRFASLNSIPVSKAVSTVVTSVSPLLSRFSDDLEKIAAVKVHHENDLVLSAYQGLNSAQQHASSNADMFNDELLSAIKSWSASGGGSAREAPSSARSRATAASAAPPFIYPPTSNTGGLPKMQQNHESAAPLNRQQRRNKTRRKKAKK